MYLPFPCSDTSPKATWTNITRIAKSTALKRGTSRKRHKLGYGHIVVVMLVNIFMLSLFWPFSYSLMQFPPSILKLSTQHPPYFLKFSTQHQPAITRIENWAIPPTQGLQFSYTLIRAFPKISAYTKTVQFYSTKKTSMNKFLAQSLSPCLMLGGIPPASLSEGWSCWEYGRNTSRRADMNLWCKPSISRRKYMMTSSIGNIFRVTGHLCGEFTGPRWIPHTKASDAELWCFLWFTPE